MSGGLPPKPLHQVSTTKPQKICTVPRILLGIVMFLVVLAVTLGLGLGVGLTRRLQSSSRRTSIAVPRDNNVVPAGTSWWSPNVGESWQIEIKYPLNETTANASVYDIDLLSNKPATITQLHALGRKVICYFSAGSYEDFRSDSELFLPADYGAPLMNWPGEWWLNTSSTNVRNIMLRRLDRAASMMCDGVDPDNTDAYNNENGLNLTMGDAVSYVSFLADAAHARNLSIGLKNSGDIVPFVLDKVQWQVNEQCVEYKECSTFRPFIAAGKPVFHIEYPSSAPTINATTKAQYCNDSRETGFSTILKKVSLDGWIDAC